MRHVIFGGNGFLGTELTKKLTALGEEVLIVDIHQDTKNCIYADRNTKYVKVDVTDPDTLSTLVLRPDDIVYHFAAKLLVPIVARKQRHPHFHVALYDGTRNVLSKLEDSGISRMVYYTTDMVYGHTAENPRTEGHPRVPIGPYGEAKYQTELLCEEYRKKDFDITIFRPRLIIGPGRLGILEKLFWLIDRNLPIPLIGNGSNYYQFISVSDCANACLKAVEHQFPNEAFNLGSANPPTVKKLLTTVIKHADSRSFLIPTPAKAVKLALDILDRVGLPLMDPEQYEIADETCVLSTEKARRVLGWRSADSDEDMLIAAYDSYRAQQDK